MEYDINKKFPSFQMIGDLIHSFCQHFLPFTRPYLLHVMVDWDNNDPCHRSRFCTRCGYKPEHIARLNK
jgi:hypothetical protein